MSSSVSTDRSHSHFRIQISPGQVNNRIGQVAAGGWWCSCPTCQPASAVRPKSGYVLYVINLSDWSGDDPGSMGTWVDKPLEGASRGCGCVTVVAPSTLRAKRRNVQHSTHSQQGCPPAGDKHSESAVRAVFPSPHLVYVYYTTQYRSHVVLFCTRLGRFDWVECDWIEPHAQQGRLAPDGHMSSACRVRSNLDGWADRLTG